MDDSLKRVIDGEFMGTPKDEKLTEFIEKVPAEHWSRYDIGALRMGWEAAKVMYKIQDQD